MNTQTTIKAYIWLLSLFVRHKRLTRDQVSHMWAATTFGDGQPMNRQTFIRYLEALENIFGVRMVCDRADGWRYHIEHFGQMRDSATEWMVQALTVGNLLSDYQELSPRVVVEPTPSAETHLGAILEAMSQSVKVRIFYQKYTAEEGRWRLVAPLCLKLHHRRWYVLTETEKGRRLFALDRIHQLEFTSEPFAMADDFDAEEYFRPVVGVTVTGEPVQRIRVRAFDGEPHYLADLPLHKSQRMVEQREEWTDFELELVPTTEFYNLILSHGSRLRVVSPRAVAMEVRRRAMEVAKGYDDC